MTSVHAYCFGSLLDDLLKHFHFRKESVQRAFQNVRGSSLIYLDHPSGMVALNHPMVVLLEI